MADFDVVIIGGGHNGLICAAYLAKGGLRPLVLERREILGGACVTEEIGGAPGYRVSTGAAQCGNLRPEIVAELELARFGFELLMPDPLTVFPFPDDRYLALWQDGDRTLEEIRARAKQANHRCRLTWSPGNGEEKAPIAFHSKSIARKSQRKGCLRPRTRKSSPGSATTFAGVGSKCHVRVNFSNPES